MKIALYARVSTKHQETELQLHDLRKFAIRQEASATFEYIETASSVKHRPIFEAMLVDARAGKFDAIAVWRIDRFARSMKDFVTITLQLDQWKVRLISVTENVDTSDANPFAEFQRGLLALLAQLERKIIVARVNAGIAEAKRQGKTLGRPKAVFARDEAVAMRSAGKSWREISSTLGVPFTTLREALNGVRKSVRYPPVIVVENKGEIRV